MFKYNGKIWNPKNPEKKLKQLGITWDDVEIIKEPEKKIDTSANEVDIEKIKNWVKILDISTSLTQVYTINDKETILLRLKKYTDAQHVAEFKNCTLVDDRFIICPYLEEIPIDLITILLKARVYREKDGYQYINITDTLIDYILDYPDISDKMLAFHLQSSVDIISQEILNARDIIKSGAVKYVPYNEYIKFYRVHSKEQIKKYFNLNEIQYQTILKKFGLTV